MVFTVFLRAAGLNQTVCSISDPWSVPFSTHIYTSVIYIYNVLYSPLSVVYVHSIFSVFIFILFILYQEAKDIECWP
jgi:hypothetical protein